MVPLKIHYLDMAVGVQEGLMLVVQVVGILEQIVEQMQFPQPSMQVIIQPMDQVLLEPIVITEQ